MTIKVIFAVGTRGEFGNKQGLPWGHCRSDMQHFAKYTERGTLVMGRNTYESLPDNGLKDRELVVVSRKVNGTVEVHEDTFIVDWVDDFHSFLKQWSPFARKGTMIVIGGPQLILEALDFADEVSVSLIHNCDSEAFEHDVNMPMGELNTKLYSQYDRVQRHYPKTMEKPFVVFETWKRKEKQDV